jgi:predicted alpha/beta hydrolase
MSIQVQDITLNTEDGLALSATFFMPEQPQYAIIINSATAVSRRYYKRFASYLAEQGAIVLTYDYRGVADSASQIPLSSAHDFWHWGRYDAHAAQTWFSTHHPRLALSVFGHSIGGLVIAYMPNSKHLQQVVTLGAQRSYWQDWRPRSAQLRMIVQWIILISSTTALLGYFPGKRLGLGMNLHQGVVWTWMKACVSNDVFSHSQDPHGKVMRAWFDEFQRPIIAYCLTDDEIGTPMAIQRLLALFLNAPQEYRERTPQDYQRSSIGHFGFTNPELAPSFWQELSLTLKA